MDERLRLLLELSHYQYEISDENVRRMISAIKAVFRTLLFEQEYPERNIQALVTKFHDAGRRSAPWRPTSSLIPGVCKILPTSLAIPAGVLTGALAYKWL